MITPAVSVPWVNHVLKPLSRQDYFSDLIAQTVYRGIERVRSRFIPTMAANNSARLPWLLAA